MEKCIWIKKGHVDYLGMKWVIEATKPINETGENILSEMEIKDHLAIACDGSRLHEYTLTESEIFPSGIYWPFRSGDNLIFIFDETPARFYPNAVSIFPTGNPIKKLQITMGKGALFDWAYTQIVRNIVETQTIQIKFLEKMLSGGTNWEISLFGVNGACFFTSPGKRGLIMPLH